jgi:hypothetical protein
VQALNEPWMTEHSVVSVGRPLLAKGHAGHDLGPDGRIEGRLRAPGTDNIVATADADGGIRLAPPEGPPPSRVTRLPGSCCCRVGAPPTPPARTAATDQTPCARYEPSWAATDRPRGLCGSPDPGYD